MFASASLRPVSVNLAFTRFLRGNRELKAPLFRQSRLLRLKVAPAASISLEKMMSGVDGRLQARPRPAAADSAPAGPGNSDTTRSDHTDHLLKVQELNLARGDRYFTLSK